MDRLDELAVLVTIVDEGSLAAAARRLRRSAPSITRVLAALEERAGARLLERTTRHLAPTEAGLALAARGRALLADYSSRLRASSARFCSSSCSFFCCASKTCGSVGGPS